VVSAGGAVVERATQLQRVDFGPNTTLLNARSKKELAGWLRTYR